MPGLCWTKAHGVTASHEDVARTGRQLDTADQLTAAATLEWFNVHYCEPFGHDAGVAHLDHLLYLR
jgi:hypothetical protein